MRSLTVAAPLRLVSVLVLAACLSTLIDPYLSFGDSLQAQLVNAVLPVLLVLLMWGLSGRAWLALLLEVVVLGLLNYSDHMKVLYLDTNLVYADFTVISSLLTDPQLVLGFVHPTAWKVALIGALLIAAVFVAWLTRRSRGASKRFRIFCLVIATIGFVVVWTQQLPYIVDSLHWEVFAQASGATEVGIAGNILLGRMTARDVKRAPDDKAGQAFWQEPLVRQARRQLNEAGSDLHPDIVIVQSESLFEPSQLCGFADTPLLKNVAAQKPSLAGNLQVPVFGGRTLQTEFEVLTGAPIAFYRGSMFSYYELMDHRIDVLPHVLDDEGYNTIAMHPNNRGFWRREVVMPEMGFATFQDIGSFIAPGDFSDRNHVSDAALTRAILSELDAASGPTFITAITMDNHGPWGDFAPKDETGLGLPAKLKGDARAQLSDYVAHAIDADRAYGFLIAALQRRQRPTIVVIYGDHLPGLPAVYDQLCFKDGKTPPEHFPPYRVWANFPVPASADITSSYLLQGWVMRAARLPLKSHLLANAIAGMVAADPAIKDADRGRILDEYANIAAANIEAMPLEPASPTVFIGRDQALDLLKAHQSPHETKTDAEVRDGDLFLKAGKGKPSQVAFDIGNALASITLRPYIPAPDVQCMSRFAALKADLTVEGDGRELYRAAITSTTLRLATLDLRGIQQLTLRIADAGEPDDCSDVNVRVAQLLCYSNDCDVPGPALPAHATTSKSRILNDDPINGDIAELQTMVPDRLKSLASKQGNLQWLIGRRRGSQEGYAPFEVGDDGQLMMIPAEDHSAWMDVDVSGVDSLELSPQINALDPQCKPLNTPGKEAGVVGLQLLLDGKVIVPRMIVNQKYDAPLPVTVKGGHILRIEVDKGNDVTWCDRFSVGVTKLESVGVSDSAVGPRK